MADRDRGKPLELRLAEDPMLTFENAPRGRPAQRAVRLIDLGQQFGIRTRVLGGEPVPPILGHRNAPRGHVAGNQPRHLRPAQPRHLLHVAPQQTARRLALNRVPLPHKDLLHPAIHLGPMPALKLETLAGSNKPADLLHAQLLCLKHADVQSPACLTPSGSSCVGIHPSFRLILCWKRLPIAEIEEKPYTCSPPFLLLSISKTDAS